MLAMTKNSARAKGVPILPTVKNRPLTGKSAASTKPHLSLLKSFLAKRNKSTKVPKLAKNEGKRNAKVDFPKINVKSA